MLLASCDDSGGVVLWNFENPEAYSTFVLQDGSVAHGLPDSAGLANAAEGDGQNLASSPFANNTGASVTVNDRIIAWSCLSFSSDGGLLACGGCIVPPGAAVPGEEQYRNGASSNPGVIKIFCTETSAFDGEELNLMSRIDGSDQSTSPWEITAMAWSTVSQEHPKGLLAFGDASGSLRLWDPVNRCILQELWVTPGRDVNFVVWVGSEVAAGHSSYRPDGTPYSRIRVYASASDPGSPWKERMMMFPDIYVCRAFSRGNSLFLSGYRRRYSHEVIVIDAASSAEQVLQSFMLPLTSLSKKGSRQHTCWSPNHKLVMNERGLIWDTDEETDISECNIVGFDGCAWSCMTWSPAGDFVLASPLDRSLPITVWAMDQSWKDSKGPTVVKAEHMSSGGNPGQGPLNRPDQHMGHQQGSRITHIAWSPALALLPSQHEWISSYAQQGKSSVPCSTSGVHPLIKARAPIRTSRPSGEKSKIEKDIDPQGRKSDILKNFYNLIRIRQDLGDENDMETLLEMFGNEYVNNYRSLRNPHVKDKIKEIFKKALGVALKDGNEGRPELDNDDSTCRVEVKNFFMRFKRAYFQSWRMWLYFAYLLVKRTQERFRDRQKRVVTGLANSGKGLLGAKQIVAERPSDPQLSSSVPGLSGSSASTTARQSAQTPLQKHRIATLDQCQLELGSSTQEERDNDPAGVQKDAQTLSNAVLCDEAMTDTQSTEGAQVPVINGPGKRLREQPLSNMEDSKSKLPRKLVNRSDTTDPSQSHETSGTNCQILPAISENESSGVDNAIPLEDLADVRVTALASVQLSFLHFEVQSVVRYSQSDAISIHGTGLVSFYHVSIFSSTAGTGYSVLKYGTQPYFTRQQELVREDTKQPMSVYIQLYSRSYNYS